MTLPNLVLWILFWMDLWGLSKNKKLLNDLIEKEKGYRNAENTSDNDSNNDESWKSGGAGGGRNLEDKEVASENGVEDDSKESDKDTENYSQETESSSPETSTTFHSENPFEHCENSNVCGTLIMKCRKCSWHDTTTKFVLYAITRSPRREITSKRVFLCVTIVKQLHTKTRRRWKPIFIPLLKGRAKIKTVL